MKYLLIFIFISFFVFSSLACYSKKYKAVDELLIKEDYPAAKEILLKMIKNNPNDFGARDRLSIIYQVQDDYEGAEKNLKKALRERFERSAF